MEHVEAQKQVKFQIASNTVLRDSVGLPDNERKLLSDIYNLCAEYLPSLEKYQQDIYVLPCIREQASIHRRRVSLLLDRKLDGKTIPEWEFNRQSAAGRTHKADNLRLSIVLGKEAILSESSFKKMAPMVIMCETLAHELWEWDFVTSLGSKIKQYTNRFIKQTNEETTSDPIEKMANRFANLMWIGYVHGPEYIAESYQRFINDVKMLRIELLNPDNQAKSR